jgi:hypothetical protein
MERAASSSSTKEDTATAAMKPSVFELQPQSNNAQRLNICWNPLVQAITHKNPALKTSMVAILSIPEVAFLPMIFAIDVTIVLANNATTSQYGLQTFRLRVNNNGETTDLAIATTTTTPSLDKNNNNNDLGGGDSPNDNDHRFYPDFALIPHYTNHNNDTSPSCQLCSDERATLRYPNDTVRWTNGTDILCQSLYTMASPYTCRVAQELIQDGECGTCVRTCPLPCPVIPQGTLPIQGQVMECRILAQSLDPLLTLRTCAVSQALVRAHCGCHNGNPTLETTDPQSSLSSSTTTTTRMGYCILWYSIAVYWLVLR